MALTLQRLARPWPPRPADLRPRDFGTDESSAGGTSVGPPFDRFADGVAVVAAAADYPETFKGESIFAYQGKSLLPALANQPIEREAVFWEHETNCAMRLGKWKLVAKERDGADDPWELYDMEADPTETANLAEKLPEKVKEMAAMWNEWAEENAVLPMRKRPAWFYEAKENQSPAS